MLRIAITPPEISDDEAKRITVILNHGWDYVHLRHPEASVRDIKNVIQDISPRLHSRLRLHGHFELLNEFNLGGIHLNSRCPEAPRLYSGPVSRTCHTVEEVRRHAGNVDFVTLSPIFDSVSKQGYKAAFTTEELDSIPEGKVVALGGITPERFDELSKYPFAGFAMLGYIFDGGTLDNLSKKLQKIDTAFNRTYKQTS